MHNQSVLIESHYLPSLEFFCAIYPYQNIVLEVNEHFIKQSFRNRCFINTAQGKKMLTVPLAERHGKILLKDVLIEDGMRWRNNHWRTIESAYRKAPFYDYYADELKEILYTNHQHLLALNKDLLSFCLRHIGLQKNISETLTYEISPNENIVDLRSVISDRKLFNERSFYQPKNYYQVFGNEFVANLSFVDLLLCEGPRSREIIEATMVN